MRDLNVRHAAAATLMAAAGAWPSLYSAFTYLLMTPYERALQSAWCGSPSDAIMVLGHCADCWVGMALLASAAIAVWLAPHPAPRALRLKLR